MHCDTVMIIFVLLVISILNPSMLRQRRAAFDVRQQRLLHQRMLASPAAWQVQLPVIVPICDRTLLHMQL